MRRDFLEMKCASKQKVSEFLDSLSVKREELAAVGVDIVEQDYSQTILKGIPPNFSHLRPVFWP
ncbi:hypothetical protein BDZ89DRAFT_1197658, partial [Hymenopellis radicata]